MKSIVLFYLPDCPYCKKAIAWQKELKEEYPELKDLEIEMVDESQNPAYAERFDYYYVPTYYVEGKKMHEGVATKEKVEAVLRSALHV